MTEKPASETCACGHERREHTRSIDAGDYFILDACRSCDCTGLEVGE